ncbi:protoheme IX farnesyltransferase [Flavimobilis sp. GY10621]|uniref:Protoheme IX farnesyltransferase n=1 Tax=Flavimobilis rhizosphaerae TaxID=2775421 RepID=A0ABR9DU05_9MICO|nr:protoheme IX farnesyltransferase [Flavimobilis rhizosphaerae]
MPSTTSATSAAPATGTAAWRTTVGAYVALTKPRIIELLLVTTIPTLFLAQGGVPPLLLAFNTLFGGTLAAASANVFNCIIDRDIDAVMNRTKKRPLVTGDVSVRGAWIFASVLGVMSFVWLARFVNLLSGVLGVAAILLYVVFYTLILKRRTSQNIVWGGVAGCMPVLIGWSAVTNSLDWAPFLLFGVVFFWTPPHYWPLSMKFRKDYANAGVPMLPVVASDRRVAVEMVLYTLAMIACSIALWPVASLTAVYGVATVLLGGWFLLECVTLLRRLKDPALGKPRAMRVFHASITYLTLLSVAIVVDVLLPF